ncbi:MAG: hypothetical protein QOJ72_2617 [Nocardioidaceae bacterium]|nr:hypothetical protein [Nocardioidaceae bacterium]
MRRHIAVSAVLMVCALGACGDKDSSGSSEPTGAKTTGSSDSGGKDTAAFDPCTKISEAEIKTILGYDVVKKETPGGGCSWGNEADPRLASLSVTEGTPADQGGGIESAKVGTQSVLNGDPQDLPGLGDAAFLIVGKGKAFAKDSFQAQGVIEANGQLITVGITQLGGASEAEVQKQAAAGMNLVGSKV